MRFNGTLMSSILISALALSAAPALAADERRMAPLTSRPRCSAISA